MRMPLQRYLQRFVLFANVCYVCRAASYENESKSMFNFRKKFEFDTFFLSLRLFSCGFAAERKQEY